MNPSPSTYSLISREAGLLSDVKHHRKNLWELNQAHPSLGDKQGRVRLKMGRGGELLCVNGNVLASLLLKQRAGR